VQAMVRSHGLEVRGPDGACGTFCGTAPRETTWNTRALGHGKLPVVR